MDSLSSSTDHEFGAPKPSPAAAMPERQAFTGEKTLRQAGVNLSVHYSSASDNWATPQDFYDKCNAEFGPFDLDVCADDKNHKCLRWFTQTDDGLKQDWIGRVWMNPPYGRTIGHWMRKAYEQSQLGALVVCLVPARTDTAWWHDYAIKGDVRFIRGRLKFGGCKNSAPFPNALVVFNGGQRNEEW